MKSAAQTKLRDVLSNLKSSKIADRRDALSTFPTIFERQDFVDRFHINDDGLAEPRTWLLVYQALFEAVLTEKLTVTKAVTSKSTTSSAAAKRRLEDTASTVRWLIERTVHLMNRRVTNAIYEHLLQTIVHRGEIFAPVALNYIKALRCLVSYTPHLEHLEDDTWIRMVEMCFNSLLGDPIKSSFEETPVEQMDDSDLFLDNEPLEEDEDTSRPKKRQRTDSTAAVYPAASRSHTRAKNRSTTQPASVSHEQVEFMGLLAILLRSTSSPILSHEYPHLAPSILTRFQRFLYVYTGDTSLLHDYILALSSTLSHLSLNVSREVAKFARGAWDALLAIWGTKNKRIKEGLVSILRILVPFITSDNAAYDQVGIPFSHADGLSKLSTVLSGEGDSRWGVGGLSLDCLRFELANHSTSQLESTANSAFVARTFRYGANFDSHQALAWSILELQADCIAKLFKLSETMQPPSTLEGEVKRSRLQNPINVLLSSIQQRSQSNVRAYNLQALLFIIDRHWHILHEALQQEVIQNLLQFVSFDDGVIQSWVFLCFSSIASAVCSLSTSSEEAPRPLHLSKPGEGTAIWDLIWTNAVRRTNVPTISRAACHTAYTILVGAYSQVNTPPSISLPSARILFEIEALAKDIDVQGPPHPYDSVCAFLANCLKIASQDMHLYKMQLEEKVLTWLIDCWQVEGLRSKSLSAYTVGDIISLLESICGLTKQSNLISRIPLPEGQIVEMLTEEAKTRVIKDFMLSANLPAFQLVETTQASNPPLLPTKQDVVAHTDRQVSPRGRERRISTFLLKTLDRLLSEWDAKLGQLTAETARQTLDMAVTALSFETDLVTNGTQSDRRLIQSACALIGTVVSLLLDTRWTIAEKALICLGLDPLISLDHNNLQNDITWNAMLPPDNGSGIRTQVLNTLLRLGTSGEDRASFSRLNFLRNLWQNADVQTSFNTIGNTFRDLLRLLLSGGPTSRTIHDGMDVDEQAGFDPIRMTAEQFSMNKNETFTEFHSLRVILDSCISFLTVGPALQSASGEPTRDRDLMEAVLGCATPRPEAFLLVSPIILAKNRQRILSLSVKNLDSFLNELSQLLQSYHYSRSHRLHILATQFLDSTMDVWASPSVAIGEPLEKVRQICTWLSGTLKMGKIKFWSARVVLANFFDRYLVNDPTQHIWTLAEDLDASPPDEWPSSLLPMLGADDDIRVRFRVAVLNAHLFALARSTERPINEMYIAIKDQLTIDLNDYERMLTRILSLGNVMVVGSAVRRGAYWHLLETCFHTSTYTVHIEGVLRGVSQRLGLNGLSSLFEAYAAQLAYSIRQSDSDFLLLPPQLLGYRDRKECATANFRAFAPTNIWNGGQQLFENHCTIIEKSPTDCLRMCFGDILGYQIVTSLDEHDTEASALGPLLRSATFKDDEYLRSLTQNVDGVVTAILRTLSDQDFSDDSPIVTALQLIDQSGSCAKTFCQLNRFRKMGQFTTHRPNLPAFPAETILRSLQWLRSEVGDVDHRATTYHVLHQLFADVDRSFLVNEQLRLINAICLWVAIHAQDFHETTLLHTLIHRTTSLMGQLDLAWSAQSILDWAFDCYRKAKAKHPRIPNILVQICCTAYDYSQTTSDDSISSLGIELLRWIDLQTYKLSQVSSLSGQVTRALPAWPHQPSSQLTQLCQSITGEHLAAVLEDHRLASSKFRLVRRLRDYISAKDYDEGHFARVDFWRLKQCIPPSTQLQDADIDAFADLLFMNKGRLDSFHSESHNSASLLHRQPNTSRTSQSQTGSAPESIMAILLGLVQGDSTSRSDIAYQTLRFIKAVEIGEIRNVHLPPSEFQAELDYLSKYKCLPRERATRDLEDLVTTDTYLNLVGNYSRWIAETTTLFSDVLSANDPFYAQIIPILRADTEFAEQVLPVLVYALLEKRDPSNAPGILHRDILSRFFSSVLSSSIAEIHCLQSIIDIVLHLRHFQYGQPRSRENRTYDALSYNKWLDIDFILLARCSITCGAYTTALLFLQLASDGRKESSDKSEDLLYEIYRHIDEPDGFYGIHDADLHRNLLKRFHHENQWEQAFRFHGAAFEAGDAVNHAEGLVMSFHSFGFDHLANDALRTVPSLKSGSSHTSHTMSYRLAWRTETWDLPERDEQSTGASLYIALRAVHRERDKRIIGDTVRRCLGRELDRLRTLGLENFAETREVVRDIMCLREIKSWVRDPYAVLGESPIGDRFMTIDPDFDFSYLESIMATRISLVRSARQQEERQQIGTLASPLAEGLINLESSCLVRLSQAARAANEVQIALNSIVRARQLEKMPSLGVFQEFANVLWCQKEEKIAVEYLDGLRQTQWSGYVRNTVSNEEKARLLSLLGSWTSSACLKKPDDIQQDYFLAAVELLAHKDALNFAFSTVTQATVYHECAIFAERQYYEIVRSPDAIRWRIYVDRKRQEIDARGKELLTLKPETQEYNNLNSHQKRARKILTEDIESSRRHNKARDTYLKQAIDMYSSCLQVSDAYDRDATIRLCSLWFANFEDNAGGLQELVGTALERVPSHKFVFLSHQLTARISRPHIGDPPKHQSNLQSLVLRMCKEHPFHNLYQLYCLQADKASTKRSVSQPTLQSERSAATSAIFERLRAELIAKDHLRDIQLLCDACVQWAEYPVKGMGLKSGQMVRVPKSAGISKISNLRVPVMTHHTPIDATMQYKDCPWIDHYDAEWTVAGGKNSPKINTCIGSDGVRYKQLFKGEGEDDLRQDAVMEQVFDLVNDILSQNRETKKRLLDVRGYKVIPLASQAGLLEFVDNTLPLGEWLPSAHTRYNSGEIPSQQIYKKLQIIFKEAGTAKQRGFMQLWNSVQPVMRHFFTEKHKTPISWFAMRLRYIRSVATTSIVGHILGLGDRHTSNILIDNVSGQVIHIDLGIAFDQGKLLPVAELVPFRMTRDMVDGMGISGTSGVFHRCAEETLRVLRDSSEVIMTVLEVFKHDPLHSWSASETKLNRVQEGASGATGTVRFGIDIGIDMSSGTAEESADRALSSVSRKLDKSLSVQSAVNQLVREATDIQNFMSMWPGWGPLY